MNRYHVVGWPLGVGLLLSLGSGLALGVPDSLTPDRVSIAEREWIVAFEPGVDPAGRQEILSRLGLRPLAWSAPLGASLAAGPLRVDEHRLLEPGIRYIEPNWQISLTRLPDDLDPDQWNLHNLGDGAWTADADIDAPEAWDVSIGAPGTVVAIVDSGIDLEHPDLRGNLWVNSGEVPDNGRDDDGNGVVDDVHGASFHRSSASPDDILGHGSHCAGIVGAAGDNGEGVVGLNWSVELMAVKFVNGYTGSVFGAAQGITYAVENGAHVINASFHTGRASRVLQDAVDLAEAAQVVIVAAAGNDGIDIDRSPVYPASFDNGNIIVVAATDWDDRLAYFSNFGPETVDLSAPGSSILSADAGGGYRFLSGTSQAAPHVAGAAALARSQYPELEGAALVDHLVQTGDALDSLDGRVSSSGRLNLARAVGAQVGEPEHGGGS